MNEHISLARLADKNLCDKMVQLADKLETLDRDGRFGDLILDARWHQAVIANEQFFGVGESGVSLCSSRLRCLKALIVALNSFAPVNGEHHQEVV